MIRLLFFYLNHICWTGILGTLAILVSPFDFRGKMVGALARVWGKILLMASGVRYRVTGLEKLDRKGHYFFAANHESAFDIPLAFGGLPYHIVPIAKIELKKIPILGWAMMGGRHIFVDRHDRRRALASLRRAKESLERNPRSVLIFPEGTRSPDGRIAQFKKGGLSMALKLGWPVVPVAMCGTRDIVPKKSLKLNPGRIEMRVGAPIDTREWNNRTKWEFVSYVRERIILLKRSWAEEQARGEAA